MAKKHEQSQIQCINRKFTAKENEADVGILSQCPPGLFCNDRGYCQTESAVSRILEDDDTDYYDLLCVQGGEPFAYLFDDGVVSCDCTYLDQATETGFVGCNIVKECSTAATLCYDYYLGFAFNGTLSTYLYQAYCLEFTKPYEKRVCYYYTYDDQNCQIVFNEYDYCSTCESYQNEDDESCTLFDCTNLLGGNQGTDCDGVKSTQIFEKAEEIPTLTLQVDETVKFLQTILIGVNSLTMQEQEEWARLTAQFIVDFWEENAPDRIQNLEANIKVLTVVTGDTLRRVLHSGGAGFVTVAYNTELRYLTDEENPVAAIDVATFPFSTDGNLQAYIEYLSTNGNGQIAMLSGIDFLGVRAPIRPGLGGKKGKKYGKKASKSSKSSKSDKKGGKGKGSHLYNPPTMDFYNEEDDDFYFSGDYSKRSKSTKRSKKQ